MFGISKKDSLILEKVINEVFEIVEGNRNVFRFQNLKTSDSNLQNIYKIIAERIASFTGVKQKDMLAMGEFILALDQMKGGRFEPTTIEGNSSEVSVIASSFNVFTHTINEQFSSIVKNLNKFANHDFTVQLDSNHIEAEMAALIQSINYLGQEISTMLKSSLQNGIDLQEDASSLKQAVETLSTASNQQAASLEETAAAMEEMTSNVQQNAQKSNDMAIMAKETDNAAKDGAALANRTAAAMTEIQTATNSINDAVAIIENIAFQTNILSLNAAVEAATAGDAGKGFAVVAQEVRNLANRSADAAKEIKALAEQAAKKSNEGTAISAELTKGFEVIAGKIEQTTMLVQDVSNASREQMQGIGQINTAVTQLDQMTQENAKVASQADSIANATIDKAQAMVDDASSKQFIGKEQIIYR